MKDPARARFWTIIITIAAIAAWLLIGAEHGIFLLLLALLVKPDPWVVPQEERKTLTDADIEGMLAKRRQAKEA